MQLGIRYETVNTGISHRLAPVGDYVYSGAIDYSGEKGILNKIPTRYNRAAAGKIPEMKKR